MLVHHADVNPATCFQHEVTETLLARLRQGDLDAFEQVYRVFERPAYTLALRLTGHHENAQEVLQGAMLKAFERVAQIRGDAPLWGRLRKLVINESLMHLRNRTRFDPAPFDKKGDGPVRIVLRRHGKTVHINMKAPALEALLPPAPPPSPHSDMPLHPQRTHAPGFARRGTCKLVRCE